METVSIATLWLPIVVSVVAVYVASSLIWMVLPHHKNDWRKLPDEDGLLASLREHDLAPGQYRFPHCTSSKEMAAPEFVEKLNQGPVGLLILMPKGPFRMGKALGSWVVYLVVVSVIVAYLTGRTLSPGSEFLAVFRVSGTTAVLAYAMAVLPAAIWWGRTWSSVFKEFLDGVAYGLLTGIAFASLWPAAS